MALSFAAQNGAMQLSSMGRCNCRSATEFVWDLSDNGLAQLEYSQSADGVVKRFWYDLLGRVIAQRAVQGGKTFTTEQAYDAANRVARVTYPGYTQPGGATVTPVAEYV